MAGNVSRSRARRLAKYFRPRLTLPPSKKFFNYKEIRIYVLGIFLTSFGYLILLSYDYHSVNPLELLGLWTSTSYFGKGYPRLEHWTPSNNTIKPFKVSISDEEILDLRARLVIGRTPTLLENEDFIEGVNTKYLYQLMKYWGGTYLKNWRNREKLFNAFKQYTTNICGLEIHFYHVKPRKIDARGKIVVPILLIHTWPGTAKDFYNMTMFLTKRRSNSSVVFEVVVPSIPGNTFSEGPKKKGFHFGVVASIFGELMTRLHIPRYFVHGYGWGAYVGHAMLDFFPKRVIGFHSTMCLASDSYWNLSNFYASLVSTFPSFFVHETRLKYYNGSTTNFLYDSGKIHLPLDDLDREGAAAADSPISLATFILEIFSNWSNLNSKYLRAGGLDRFDRDAILDVITAYWFTNSIGSSLKVFRDTFQDSEIWLMGIYNEAVYMPTACFWFGHEMLYYPGYVLRRTYTNLLFVTELRNGGHFGLHHSPSILVNDIFQLANRTLSLK